MRLTKLKLTNYRNCADLELGLYAQKILIAGKNAQGKTNILESIYFLSGLRAQRTSNPLELILFNKDAMRIDADLIKADTNIEMSVSYDREKTRTLKLNGAKTTPKNFKSVLKSVLFSSSDLMLLRGGSSDRRNWLDRAISQVYPAYDERLTKYDKIRIQKNNFLKDGARDAQLLDVLNEQLVIAGSNIIFLRKKFLTEIAEIAAKKHLDISNGEKLAIRYKWDGTAEQIAEEFRAQLQERAEEELRRGQSCVGPHRDDVAFFINDEDAVKFASQGQQRTIVLALKLSELDIITEKTGDNPILLLDDVLAELDDVRQNYLLKVIDSQTQTIITSVDAVVFDKGFIDKTYQISGGNII